MRWVQGRNELRWTLGQETSLAPPYSNLSSFGTKSTVLKKVLVTLLELFGALTVILLPHSDSALGKLCPPWPPSLRPLVGLPEVKKQQGRKLDETCRVRICKCEEKNRKINDEKVATSRKSKTHNRQRKQDPFQFVSV